MLAACFCILGVFPLIAWRVVACPLRQDSIQATSKARDYSRERKLLESSTDRPELAKTATRLAASADPQAHEILGELLASVEFLARLDDLSDEQVNVRNLSAVLKALANHPSAATERISLKLAESEQFNALDERRGFLLPVAASVKPLSEKLVEFFRRANAEGYFSTSAPLLVKNGSPAALELFSNMIKDADVPAETRVDAIHDSVLPYRHLESVLRTCEQLLSADLEEAVAFGLIETVFDFQSKRWFGPASDAPVPQKWDSAADGALQLVVKLAEQAKRRDGLPSSIAMAVDRTVDTVQRILATRQQQRELKPQPCEDSHNSRGFIEQD
jgi:hypothetical protein